jgi:hypothetical protein
MLTNNGGFMGTSGNLPGTNTSHHLTLTGDPGGGIMRAHDTFQVGNQSINLSGGHYNNLAPTNGVFNPGPEASAAFRQVFNGI